MFYIKIIEINTQKDFYALRDIWNETLELTNNDVFSTWEWLYTWWKYFGKKRKLLILLAKENEKIIGIAPLMISTIRVFGQSKSIVEFVGAEHLHTGYNDFIIINNHQKCIKLFFDYLNNVSKNWIYTRLIDIPEKSNSMEPLIQLSNKIELSHECLTVPLSSSFSDFLITIQTRARKSFKNKLKKLNKKFKVELVDYSDPNLVTQGMNKLFDLHQNRWKIKKGFKGMFVDPRFRDFSLEVADALSRNGRLGLYALEISGKTVAIQWGMRYNSKYYSNLSGLDSEYLHYNVGILLRFLIIEKCIQDKFIEYDFLWGNDMWKKRFKPKLKCTYNSIVLRKKLSAKVIALSFTKYKKGRNIIDSKLRKFISKPR